MTVGKKLPMGKTLLRLLLDTRLTPPVSLQSPHHEKSTCQLSEVGLFNIKQTLSIILISILPHAEWAPKAPNEAENGIMYSTRSLGALQAPTSSWRPFGPLDFVLPALWALRPVCQACLRSGPPFLTILTIFDHF